MDGSQEPHRRTADRGQPPAWGAGDGFTTPDGSGQRQPERMDVGSSGGLRLGSSLLPSGTPATRIAAAAVGRRLDWGAPSFSLARGAVPLPPPGFDLGRQSPATSVGGSHSPLHSAFATPVAHQHGLEWGSDQELADARGGWTPLSGKHIADGPPTPFGARAVDEDFILNLHQEGDLERLTRKAVSEARTAWKPLAMDALRKQVASLDADEWIHSQ